MKKYLLVLLAFLMLSSGVTAQENYLESADTGFLVQTVSELIPMNKIEIINSTCVIGMDNLQAADGIPAIVYSYWSGNYGYMQNTLGLKLQDSKAVSIIMTFDRGMEEQVLLVKKWITDYAPKDDRMIEEQVRSLMHQNYNKDKDYILLRAQDQKFEIARTIAFVYCTKEMAKENGFPVD